MAAFSFASGCWNGFLTGSIPRDRLERLGIHYDEVTQELEDNGVRMFDAAWDRLGEQLAATLRARSAPRQGS